MEKESLVLMSKKYTGIFAYAQILGVFVKREKDVIYVKNVCEVNGIVSQGRDGQTTITPMYFWSDLISEGVWEFPITDFTGIRSVTENEEIVRRYDEVGAKYRAHKAGLVTPVATMVPRNSPDPRGN